MTIALHLTRDDTEMAQVHNDPHLRDTLTTLPGWKTTAEEITALDRLEIPAAVSSTLSADLDQLVIEATSTGVLDHDAVVQAITRDQVAAQVTLKTEAAVRRRRGTLAGHLDQIVRANETAICAAMTTRLEETVAAARAHGQDPTGRIKADYSWAQTIRQKAGWTATTIQFDDLWTIRNPAQAFDQWVDMQQGGEPNAFGQRFPITAPWDRDGWASYLINSTTAEVWVPTRAQAKAADEQLAKLLRPTVPLTQNERPAERAFG